MTYYAKLWTDILDDPKLIRAARQGAKQLVYLPWLIAYAKRADDEGRLSIAGLPAEPVDIARSIPGGNIKHVAESMQWLVSVGILAADDDGALRFVAWRRRNWMSPSDTPEAVKKRVDRHRAGKRVTTDETESVTTPVTTPVTTLVTGSETTARSRDVDEDEDLDKNKDSDKDGDVNAAAATAREAAIATKLTTAAGRTALTAIVAKAPNKLAWVSEIMVALEGMHGPALTPAQLDEALRDYVGNGALERPNLKSFRNYLRVATNAPPSGAAPTNGSGRGRYDGASFLDYRPKASDG